ncbi:MAG: YggT family protein, partial [Eubacteriales bacterium]|nr:YggT family protein [Eubacteriales bacterium]
MRLALMETIRIVFQIINIVLTIRIFLSWLPIGRNAFTMIIYNLTEPLLCPIREMLKKSPLGQGMMLDFSPIVLVLILSIIERLLFIV